MFEPHGATNQQIAPKPCNVPKMTPGRAALVILMHRYLGGLFGPFCDTARSAQANVANLMVHGRPPFCDAWCWLDHRPLLHLIGGSHLHRPLGAGPITASSDRKRAAWESRRRPSASAYRTALGSPQAMKAGTRKPLSACP